MTPAPSAEGRFAPTRWTVVAAAILVLLGVWLVRVVDRRGGPGPGPPPEHSVALLEPRGDLASAPGRFAWQATPGAVRYTIRISDADAIWPLFVRSAEAPSLALDARESAALLPGRIHVWEVEAHDASGRIVAAGGTQFRIVRRDPGPPP